LLSRGIERVASTNYVDNYAFCSSVNDFESLIIYCRFINE